MFKKTKFALGLVAGAIFGLAFAPKKGKELREEIAGDIKKGGDSSKILKKTAKQIGDDVVSTAKEVYADPEVQKQIHHGKKEAVKTFNKIKKQAEGKVKEWQKGDSSSQKTSKKKSSKKS